MFTKPVSAALFAVLLLTLILIRVFLTFEGAFGVIFNVATFVLIFVGANYVWQRSEWNQRRL